MKKFFLLAILLSGLSFASKAAGLVVAPLTTIPTLRTGQPTSSAPAVGTIFLNSPKKLNFACVTCCLSCDTEVTCCGETGADILRVALAYNHIICMEAW